LHLFKPDKTKVNEEIIAVNDLYDPALKTWLQEKYIQKIQEDGLRCWKNMEKI
jgi:hypothetical protein